MIDDNNTKTFLLGAVAGGLMGLLLAPKSGERLRKDICSVCKQIADEAKNMVRDVSDDVQDGIECGEKKVKQLASDVKEKVKSETDSAQQEFNSYL